MTGWIIEPRDPLIVRDGRPFGPDPGARARSLQFPFPSTTTGALRHKAGLRQDGTFDDSRADEVLKIGMRGPLLVALNDDGSFKEWLPPAPADALLLRRSDSSGQEDDDARRVRLLPLQPPAGSVYLPPRSGEPFLVGPQIAVSEKPLDQPPRFWRWAAFERWLIDPEEGPCRTHELGIAGPCSESRMHVGIQAATQTAEEGRLFQTSGLEFAGPARERLALAVESDRAFAHWNGGLAPIGGERRLAAWRQEPLSWPACPQQVRDRIVQERACRLILLTPARFSDGYRPAWLLGAQHGVQPQLQACVVPRPQVVSGWDLKAGGPRPTRRLAPAGSVYFLKLDATDAAAIAAWIDAIWMHNVSDESQDRLDGFGLAALGTWDGAPVEMEVQ
jgi:CRISPR-associated protein Cmr3